MSFLLDTMVVSELRKHRPHGGLLAWYAAHPQSAYAVSSITLFEMQSGAEVTRRQDSAKATQIERWIEEISKVAVILSIGEPEAREAARLLAGRPQQLLQDAMIAATAQVNGLTVATRNTRHFKQFGVAITDPFLFPKG